jgi:hypothetical protein
MEHGKEAATGERRYQRPTLTRGPRIADVTAEPVGSRTPV